MAKRNVYHVVPDKEKGSWKLKKEGSDRALKNFNTKKEAIKTGRQIAKNQEPSQLKIHKQDGKIQTEYTYKSDPRKYKG
jgi:hypothetical protein